MFKLLGLVSISVLKKNLSMIRVFQFRENQSNYVLSHNPTNSYENFLCCYEN